MKRILLASAAAVAIAAPAFAADLPVAAPMPYKAPAYVAGYNWTGFYIGANLGGGFSSLSDTGSSLTAAGAVIIGSTASGTTNLSGVVGGGQIGYNWQAGHAVFGLEADFDGSSQRGSSSAVNAFGTVFGTVNENWFSTIRGRLGYAADRWLFYVTGGVAFENGSASATFTPTGFANVPFTNGTTTRTGYTVGGGIETALWGNWTGGVEYLYIDTGSYTINSVPITPLAGVSSVTNSERFQNNVIRAKLNFRF
jgi:outer membrane immunogenic protein